MEEKLFTVGEIAKKLNVTVRTIQYYDQVGLAEPSSFSEGGRRLYSMQDYVKLHQIISLKDFGFTLKEIKEQLMPAETIEEMDLYLHRQEELIKEEISRKKITYELINRFREEMNELERVDWEMFMEVIELLRNQDEHYWIVKYLDKDLYSKIKEEYQKEKGREYVNRMKNLCVEAKALKEQGASPKSKEAQEIARSWWKEVMEFTKGDRKLIEQLTALTEKSKGKEETEFLRSFREVEEYISESLTYYFEKVNSMVSEEERKG